MDTFRPTPMPAAAVCLLCLVLGGCMEWSPFQTDLDADEREQTARNLERLDAQPPPPGDALRFAVISDSHQRYDELCEIVDTLNARSDVALVFHLGDMTEQGLRQEYRWTLRCLQRLRMPFFAGLGNHDTLSNGRDVFHAMFGAFDYSFDYDDVRFVVLNTNELEFGGAAPDLEWLADVADAAAERRALIVLGHQRPPRADYEQVLREHGASALITGHFHQPRHDVVAGVPGFELGSTQARQWGLFSVRGWQVRGAPCVGNECGEEVP